MKQGKAWIEEVFVTDSLFAAVVYSCKQMTLQNCRGSWVPPIDHVQNFNLFQRCKRSFQSISCLLGLKMKERHHSLAVLYMPDHLLCELLQKNTFVPVSWTLSRISCLQKRKTTSVKMAGRPLTLTVVSWSQWHSCIPSCQVGCTASPCTSVVQVVSNRRLL